MNTQYYFVRNNRIFVTDEGESFLMPNGTLLVPDGSANGGRLVYSKENWFFSEESARERLDSERLKEVRRLNEKIDEIMDEIRVLVGTPSSVVSWEPSYEEKSK